VRRSGPVDCQTHIGIAVWLIETQLDRVPFVAAAMQANLKLGVTHEATSCSLCCKYTTDRSQTRAADKSAMRRSATWHPLPWSSRRGQRILANDPALLRALQMA
jgi:hypothetical protein